MSTGKHQPKPVSVSGCQLASSVRPPTSGCYQNKVDKFWSHRWVSVITMTLPRLLSPYPKGEQPGAVVQGLITAVDHAWDLVWPIR